MRRRIVAASFAALLGLSTESSTSAAAALFSVDDDTACTDQSRQAKAVHGGFGGYANQAKVILWLQTDPSVDPTLSYTMDVVHNGTTVFTGRLRFSTICGPPNAQWRSADVVYNGFISGGRYTFVLHEPTGTTIGSDSVRLFNGPGM